MKSFTASLLAALALVSLTACNHEVRAPARATGTAAGAAARTGGDASTRTETTDASNTASTTTSTGASAEAETAATTLRVTESVTAPSVSAALPASARRDDFYSRLARLKGLWKTSGMETLTGQALDPIDAPDSAKPFDLSPDLAAVRANLDLRAARASSKILPAASLTVEGISKWARAGLEEDFSKFSPEFDQLDIALNRIPNGEIDESVRRAEAARLVGIKNFLRDARVVSAIADWKVTSMSAVAANGDANRNKGGPSTVAPASKTAADRKLIDDLNAAEGTKTKTVPATGTVASAPVKKTAAELEADRKAAEKKKLADKTAATEKSGSTRPAEKKTDEKKIEANKTDVKKTEAKKTDVKNTEVKKTEVKKTEVKKSDEKKTPPVATEKTGSGADVKAAPPSDSRRPGDKSTDSAARTAAEKEKSRDAAKKAAAQAKADADRAIAEKARLERERTDAKGVATEKARVLADKRARAETDARKAAGTDSKRISRKQFDSALAMVKRSFDDAKIGELFNRTLKTIVDRESLDPIAKEYLSAYASFPTLYTLAPKGIESRLDALYSDVLKDKRPTDDDASLAERSRADLRADLVEISATAESLQKRLEHVVVADFPEDVSLVAESKRLHGLVRILRSANLDAVIANWKKNAGAPRAGAPEKGTPTSKKNGKADVWAAAPVEYRFGDVKASCFGADARSDTFVLLPNVDGRNPKCAKQLRVTLELAVSASKKLSGDDTKICLGTIPHVGEKSHYAVCALANMKAKSCGEAEIESCKQDASTIVVTTAKGNSTGSAPDSGAGTDSSTPGSAPSATVTPPRVASPSAAAAMAIDD